MRRARVCTRKFGLLTINRDETDREEAQSRKPIAEERGGDGSRGRRAESKGEEMEDERWKPCSKSRARRDKGRKVWQRWVKQEANEVKLGHRDSRKLLPQHAARHTRSPFSHPSSSWRFAWPRVMDRDACLGDTDRYRVDNTPPDITCRPGKLTVLMEVAVNFPRRRPRRFESSRFSFVHFLLCSFFFFFFLPRPF